MPPIDHVFQRAEGKYLEGSPLLPDELDCMGRFSTSEDPRIASIACGALLRDAAARPEQKQQAREILKRLCSTAQTHVAMSELSITLLMIPYAEIQDDAVRQFMYGLIKAPAYTLRANAVANLERLASRGDQNAIELLRAATTDPSEVVSKSASATLKRLHLGNE